jgi:hypothetical protein
VRSAVWAVLFLMFLGLAGPVAAAPAPKPVLAHYMPWYVAKPYSSSWGWHWTMNHYNPDNVGPDGRRAIAGWYYPAIGPYDSADPAVLEYHVLLMKLTGLDGVIVDWYGMDNYLDYGVNNQRTAALFNYTKKAGLKFCLCYEDATIQQEINGSFIIAASAAAHAQQTLRYAESNYFVAPSYLRWSNQPVFLNFGPQYFKASSDWQTIFSVLNTTNQPAFFPEDNRLAVGAGAFDWPPMWMSQANGGVLSATQLETYLSGFEQKALAPPAWPAFVSGAFPRFHDIYQQAWVGSSYGYLDDRGGDTLRETLGRAFTNASAIVQVVTWNDFGEGTVVEPTLDYGFRDLGILQDFRRQYLDASFACHTNDLALALRLYNLRRQAATNAIISAELDRVFTNAVSGNLALAGLQLTGLEATRPVIYDALVAGGQLSFSIGGYLSTAGLQVQTSSNLAVASWETVSTLPAATSQPTFSIPIATEGRSAFFRVRNAGP